ncbi:MAG TPA: ubiquinone biosynthesis regulatory protein kinase UbiB, partial [Aquabacterium sp.]|nr:ubiquinone biosynthesis regulatory protein kinase UbiB [Aquabacterium sp.]
GRQLDPELDLWSTAKPFLEQWMHEQVGLRGLWDRLKREAPRYAKMLPELPRLIHQNLESGSLDIRRDLNAILAEQRRTNRILSGMAWVALGFFLGLMAAHLMLRLHAAGVL